MILKKKNMNLHLLLFAKFRSRQTADTGNVFVGLRLKHISHYKHLLPIS